MRTQSYYYLRNLIIDKFKSKNVFLGKIVQELALQKILAPKAPEMVVLLI